MRQMDTTARHCTAHWTIRPLGFLAIATLPVAAVVLAAGTAEREAHGATTAPAAHAVQAQAAEDDHLQRRGRLLGELLQGDAVAGFCGGRVDAEDVPLIQQRQDAGLYDALDVATLGSFTIPMTIHVVRRSSGMGGITTGQVDQTIAHANAIWQGSGLQFCQYGPTRYIDSDFWFNTTVSGPLADVLRSIDPVPNTINVYFIPRFSLCGLSSFTWSGTQGIIMMNNCSSGVNPEAIGVFAHELGHYFDLLHTHEPAVGIECTSGSNCASAGDLVCDTPADPGLWGEVSAGCQWVGDSQPPDQNPCSPSDPPYDPSTINVMSYTRFPCMAHMTQGQIDRALATLMNFRTDLLVLGGCGHVAACGGGSGDCFASNGSPGCDDSHCCARVCAQDPYCCNVNWDGLCADQAGELCRSGNLCEQAELVGDGSSPILDLLGFSPSGATSSCSGANATDRWLRYTASCTGTATAGICTEFIIDNVAISVYETCGGSAIACSNNDPGCVPANLNARVSWPAVAGTEYLLRVSAVQTDPHSFDGSMHISCSGCGAAGSGNCFIAQSGSPFCEDHDCCQYVCSLDPYCCNVNWDGLCANQAAQYCTPQCGSPIAGSCFDPSTTPHCDRPACCSAICNDDPFCCNVAWDGLCAAAASTTVACNVIESGGLHFVPLGAAQLGAFADGVVVDNIGHSGADGVRLNLEGVLPGGVGSFASAVAPMFLEASSKLKLSALTSGMQGAAGPSSIEFRMVQSLTEILIALSVGGDTYTVRVFDGNTLVHTETGQFGAVVAKIQGIVTPNMLGASVESGELSMRGTFNQPVVFFLGPQGFPAVQGTRIVATTELASFPGAGGVPLELGTLRRIEVTAAGMMDFDFHNISLLPPAGCAGNCGDQSPLGCWCDALCFDIGDCCADICDACSALPGCATCPGDLNGDSVVDVSDLLILLGGWGACGDPADCPPDLNGDGVVDVSDLLILLGAWGACST